MKVLLTGGGTAGHINPALAIAGVLREKHPDADIRFVGSKNSMEEKLVPAAGFPLSTVEIRGLNRKKPWRNIKTLRLLLGALRDVRRLLREFQPDIVIGTGGYVSFPAIYEARKLGIPSVIHEQNAFPGVTSKMTSRHVDRVMLTVEESRQYFPKAKDRCVVTGLPVRTEVLMARKKEARARLGFDERPLVLSVGGSLGSRMFNEVLCDVLLSSVKKGALQHVHVTGRAGWEWVPARLREGGWDPEKAPGIRVLEYVDMAPYLAACDIIVTRCGASILAEIEAQCKPSVLVPSPRVAENHQFYNGQALVKQDAAVMIEEKDLTPARLEQTLDALAGDAARLHRMAENAGRMAILDANERIYAVIREVIEAHKKAPARGKTPPVKGGNAAGQ